MRKIFLIAFSGLLFLVPILVNAQGLVPCGGPGQPHCQLCHFFVLFNNVIGFILIGVVPFLAALMFVIAGTIYFTSAGNPGKISRATSLITTIIIGLMITYGAWLIVLLFFSTIGVAEWTGLEGDRWSVIKIDCPTEPTEITNGTIPDSTEPVMVILNSNSGKSCAELCFEQGMTCDSVGTNIEGTDTTVAIISSNIGCTTEIGLSCSSTLGPSTVSEIECWGENIPWTNCRCK